MAKPFADGTWCPSVPAALSSEWRMNVAQFGDGYEQRQLDGLNPLNRTYEVTYGGRHATELAGMNAYLISMGAAAFPFRDPVSMVEHLVFVDNWNIEWNMVKFLEAAKRDVYGTLTASFRIAYGASADPAPGPGFTPQLEDRLLLPENPMPPMEDLVPVDPVVVKVTPEGEVINPELVPEEVG